MRESFFCNNEWWCFVGGTWLLRSFPVKSSHFLSLYLLLPFVRENILRIAICSVKNKCNSDGVVNVSFLSCSLSLCQYFYWDTSPTTRFLSLDSCFYSSLLSFFSKIHYNDHENGNMRIQNDQKKKKEEDKRIRERTILTKHSYYSTRISFLYEITICYSYRFDMFLIFNFIQIINKRMLN
jgi:hypothetical protein